MTGTVSRLLRQPLIWLAIVALALLTLAALETTGGSGKPGSVSLTQMSDHPNPEKTKAPKHKHCTDGKGKDADKNKHCRPPSSS